MIPKRYYLTLVSLVPILLAQAYLARRAWKVARTSPNRLRLWRIAVSVGCVLFAVSILTVFDNLLRLPPALATVVQTLVNLYGLTTAVIVVILVAIEYATSWLPTTFRRDRRQVLKLVANAGIAAPIMAAGFGIVERTNFEVSETLVHIPGLTKDLDGVRLLQISDIHLGPYLSSRTLAKVIDAANELKPHMVFVTGDLITSKHDPLDACLAELARLRADAPTLGCLGNHEVYAEAVDHTVRNGARLGIEFLRYQAKTVKLRGAELNVAGVDYEPFDMAPHYLRKASTLARPGMVNVLMSHNPDVFPVAAAQGFDLTVSGHMHGGQITCEFLNPALNPARIMTPFVRGLYRIGERSCYVTRGIGTLGVPVRLGARPEITLLTLRSA